MKSERFVICFLSIALITTSIGVSFKRAPRPEPTTESIKSLAEAFSQAHDQTAVTLYAAAAARQANDSGRLAFFAVSYAQLVMQEIRARQQPQPTNAPHEPIISETVPADSPAPLHLLSDPK